MHTPLRAATPTCRVPRMYALATPRLVLFTLLLPSLATTMDVGVDSTYPAVSGYGITFALYCSL
ncbi:hypothetical protein B0H12DRAFT_102952 [Mycena haematopus]|nr:hypothetical protein B0H12DRAFT_102952 [Mycena haematopus]